MLFHSDATNNGHCTVYSLPVYRWCTLCIIHVCDTALLCVLNGTYLRLDVSWRPSVLCLHQGQMKCTIVYDIIKYFQWRLVLILYVFVANTHVYRRTHQGHRHSTPVVYTSGNRCPPVCTNMTPSYGDCAFRTHARGHYGTLVYICVYTMYIGIVHRWYTTIG
jgi:hypothetical protein